jgi:hypothetical protein
MWSDFTKKILPEPILTPEEIKMYKQYMKDIGYVPLHVETIMPNKKKKGKKRFNKTSCKNKA